MNFVFANRIEFISNVATTSQQQNMKRVKRMEKIFLCVELDREIFLFEMEFGATIVLPESELHAVIIQTIASEAHQKKTKKKGFRFFVCC